MYRVVKAFTDLQGSHAYSVGDTFPHNGVEVAESRIAELAGSNNRLGVPLIEQVPEKPKKARKKAEE